MTSLPEAFIERIREQLGAEADAFLATYADSRTQGLRRNSLKLSADHPVWRSIEQEFSLEPISWCSTGSYYPDSARPGRSVLHAAGLYYIQEPSAMSSAELLAPEPGETVLDLAAAPGGKSTQIAFRMKGSGLLVSNEIHPGRAKILSENLERTGVRNAVVTSMNPQALADKFPAFFDRIMLDAPCSGEGMFRKDPEAVAEWTADSPAFCAARQKDILKDAVRMLKPGGVLGYSTCTFNREENEDIVDWLLDTYPAFKLLRMERIWPHRERGEGHFVAILQWASAAAEELDEAGDEDTADAGFGRFAAVSSPPVRPDKNKAKGHGKRAAGSSAAAAKQAKEAMALFEDFAAANLPGFAAGTGEPLLFGEQLYWLPHGESVAFTAERLDGVRVLRPGLHLAELKKGRLEPAYALAIASQSGDAARVFPLEADDALASMFLRGEALQADGYPEGWTLVTVAGFPVGWGKISGGQLKNHYPKGLRQQK
ncbi:RsmF rRNA methyltransferase first C-terminal domain-containing protein [Gorillibacterium timonense]|uniref:RsmF rRNA methyltransferase first C-terminal domain-containing protein n=1 Tax=Gorillibacterium timonense TaxID=1689269 RepID=UPI00071DC239|nr:RsmF rRNA methyltransferase first C-terminal domain-containing protein [Gorillibacterium timonense]